ncbi:MAG: biotin/lipoyl-containing protein [Dehalococcoidia bacterium]
MAARHRFVIGGRERVVLIDEVDGRTTVTIDDGDPIEVDPTASGIPGLFSLVANGSPSRAYVSRRAQGFDVTVDGRRFEVAPAGAARGRGVVGGAEDTLGRVSSPLAGVVVSINVEVGEAVETGHLLCVVEAMKMQNEVHAPHPGTISALHAAPGARVERGDLLLEYTPTED